LLLCDEKSSYTQNFCSTTEDEAQTTEPITKQGHRKSIFGPA
jgi:hypothetical protein